MPENQERSTTEYCDPYQQSRTEDDVNMCRYRTASRCTFHGFPKMPCGPYKKFNAQSLPSGLMPTIYGLADSEIGPEPRQTSRTDQPARGSLCLENQTMNSRQTYDHLQRLRKAHNSS